jgi:hypothetical protein
MADRRSYLQSSNRSSSVPPKSAESSAIPSPPIELASNLLAAHRLAPMGRVSSDPSLAMNKKDAKGLDLMANLQRSEPSIVKTRSGSVLSRGFILKTDHYPSGLSDIYSASCSLLRQVYITIGRALDLEINIHGAPNFRAAHPVHFSPPATLSPSQPSTPTNTPTNLNVYGCAQPRTQGLRAILSVLRCRPGTVGEQQGHVVWFCTREEPIGTFACF